MTRAEIYKIRHHRTPLVCTVLLLLGVLTPSFVLTWYTPQDPSAYMTSYSDVFAILTPLLGIVFGGWLLGSEYRQGTVKRLLASEPRRARVLTIKGLVGAGAMSVVLAAAGVVGWATARLVGSMNDVTVPWEGRALLAVGISGLAAATVAYVLSAITRSDSFAMVGSLAMMVVFQPLISAIPRIGKYSFGSALDRVSTWVSGDQVVATAGLSTSAAIFVLLAWLGVFIQIAGTLFSKRDV